MKAGIFNINDYLNKLYENAEENEKKEEEKEVAEKASPKKTSKQSGNGFLDGGEHVTNSDGILIPNENKKSYDWLKKEFQKGKVEVKVEMKMGGAKFEPGYDLQTNLDSIKDFKPGMYGEVKTVNPKDTTNKDKTGKNQSLDTNKSKESFSSSEGKKQNSPEPKKSIKTSMSKPANNSQDIKNNKQIDNKSTISKEKPEVKKIDLKTKKK